MTSAAYVAALKPLLEARPGLAGVDVHLIWTADVTAPAIVLIRSRVTHDTEWTRMGPKRTVTATIPGSVYTRAEGFQAAADQAELILTEIASAITPASPAVGANMWKAEMPETGWMPLMHEDGGWFVDAQYDITYTSDLA